MLLSPACGQIYFSCLLYHHQIKYFVCYRDGFFPSSLPQVGMEFSSTDEAGMFWVSYGGQKKVLRLEKST